MATDFPTKGDDLKVSLRNSQYPQFDYDFALNIKESEPEIWGAGGNIRGNEAFEFWTKARNDQMTEGTVEWIREREAWAARHFKDGVQFEDGDTEPTLSNIGGVVAAMKWGVILDIGERKMKDTVLEMVKKLEGKKDREMDEAVVRHLKEITETEQTVLLEFWKGGMGNDWEGINVMPEVIAEQEDDDNDDIDERAGHEDMEEMAESMDEDRDLSESTRTALENKRDAHNDEVGDVESKRVTLPMLEDVFNRGVGAYETNPESVRPNVQSAEQWAMARVNSFLFAVKNERFQGGEHDRDLMPEGHPLRSEEDRMEMDETMGYGMEEERSDPDYAERMEMGVDDDRPYPNEHAARITDPALYQEFRREVDAGGEGVDFIFGIKMDDGQRMSEIQSIRFDREMFTPQEAMDWLDEHEFVAIKFEEASEERTEHEERKANGQFLTRDAHSEFVNEAEGTVQLVVSTETPVERGFGQEVLSHAADAVDLEYLNSGRAPLLLDHSFEKQIGVIKSVELDQANRKIRATVKFGRNDEQSRSVFQDVVDGIRQNVSIGYKVHEMERDESDGSGTTYRVTKWEPLEVSMVAVGADVNAMVGRQVEVKQSEQSKAAEKIRALGEAYKMKGEAEQAIEGGMSIEDFRAKIHSKFGQDIKETQMSDIGLTNKEQRSYSLRKALFALSNPGDRRAQEAAAFEFEVSNAASRSGSFTIPFEVAGPISRRDMTTSTDAGAIGESFREGDFIEALRNQSSVMRAGATMLTGLEGTIKIPRQSAITAAAFLTTEGVTTNEDDPSLDAVTMDAKMLGITSTATKLLLNTASIDVENLIRNDLTRSIATGMDLAGLSGAGTTGVPTGIRNTAGINTVDFAANGPTFAEIVTMESRVAQDNALMGSLFYVLNPADYGRLKTTEKATNTAEFIVDRDGLVNGYEVIRSSQVAEDEYYFMDGSSLLVGVFGPGVEITVDPFSEANKGLVNITATVAMDIAVRHPESFCLGANTLP